MLIKAILKNKWLVSWIFSYITKKNCIKLPSIGENVIEPQSNLSERPNITDFSAISFLKQTKFFSTSIVDTYFQEYFSLFLYQLTSYSAAQSKYGDQSRGKKLCIWVWASLICTLELVTQPPIGSAASVGRGPLAHGGLSGLAEALTSIH